MTQQTGTVDWHDWMKRWDVQQTGYLPLREARFNMMFDVLEVLLPAEGFTAVDLACGPGAISQRLLARFPKARCVAVDLDPVLLALGQGALGEVNGRLRWVEADLTQPEWIEKLGETQVDAVLSTTALHWLPVEHLVRLYEQLGGLVRPGGVVLNGDHMSFPTSQPAFRQVASTLYARQEKQAFEENGVENWERWWAALAEEPEAKPLLEERERRFGWRRHTDHPVTLDLHEAALRSAGFSEVGVIWQNMDDRVLLGVR